MSPLSTLNRFPLPTGEGEETDARHDGDGLGPGGEPLVRSPAGEETEVATAEADDENDGMADEFRLNGVVPRGRTAEEYEAFFGWEGGRSSGCVFAGKLLLSIHFD